LKSNHSIAGIKKNINFSGFCDRPFILDSIHQISQLNLRDNMKTPEVLNVKDLVQYQDDSIVSKTLVVKDTGTITMFAFSEGQGLSEHTAPFDAIAQIIDGSAEIIISGNKYNVKDGEMIIMPANEPHALNAISKFKMMLIMIKEKK
jgi:quercetin dioxygenase-like cupin family protein